MAVDVREMIKQVKTLPPLSQALTEFLEVYTHEHVTFEEIGDIVKADAALAAATLKVANSAESGLNRTIDSVQEAVAYLGRRTMLSIAFQLGVGDLLNRELEGYEADNIALWEHCQYTAIAARELSKYARVPINPDVAYTAGLIHDIGKVVLNMFMSGSAEKYLQAIEEHDASDFSQAERYILGVDHSEAGMILATVWRLPQILRNVIRYHHEPSEAPEEHRSLCIIVQAADIIAQMGGYGTGFDALQYRYDPSLNLHLDIDKEKEQKIVFQIGREFERSLNSMSCLV